MTDKVQKIREEVERLMAELIQEKGKGYGSDVDDACILELQNVLTFIDSLQEEPASDGLEEAAKEHAVERFRTTRDEFLAEKCKWSFKAGAQWQKRQGIIEQAEINYWNQRGLSIRLEDKCLEDLGFEEGDKVRIIIIKED